jgi:hypothetical protein
LCIGVTGEGRLLFAGVMNYFLYVNRRYTGHISCSVNVLILEFRMCVLDMVFYVYDVNMVRLVYIIRV